MDPSKCMRKSTRGDWNITDSGWTHQPGVTLMPCINSTTDGVRWFTVTGWLHNHTYKEITEWNMKCVPYYLMDFSNASGGTWRFTAVWFSEWSDSSRSPWFIKLLKCRGQNAQILISPHYASAIHSDDVNVNFTELQNIVIHATESIYLSFLVLFWRFIARYYCADE